MPQVLPAAAANRTVHRFWRRWWLFAWAAMYLAQAGCVTRRLTIISDPPGATAYVDNEEVGTTPCSVGYIYYGTRQITLVKDGYETRTVMQEFPTPWYEYFPLEFVSENLIPWELRDERTVEYKLLPQMLTPVSQILQRGQDLRQSVQTQRSLMLPGAPVLPGAIPQGGPPPGTFPNPPFPAPSNGQFVPPSSSPATSPAPGAPPFGPPPSAGAFLPNSPRS